MGKLEQQIVDKAKSSGDTFITANPRFSSQQCQNCGQIAKENRESQAIFNCVKCRHENHADINAGQVVLVQELSVLASTLYPRPFQSCQTSRSAWYFIIQLAFVFSLMINMLNARSLSSELISCSRR